MTESEQPRAGHSRRAVFRIPGTALLTIIILLFCITPVAWAVPGLQVLYLVPIGLAAWIIRTRTTATSEGLVVRTVFGTRELPWAALSGLAITPKSTVQAVLADGGKVALPAVRTRHLPVLSLVSDGRLADPSGVLDAEDEPSETDEAHGTAEPREPSGSNEPAEPREPNTAKE